MEARHSAQTATALAAGQHCSVWLFAGASSTHPSKKGVRPPAAAVTSIHQQAPDKHRKGRLRAEQQRTSRKGVSAGPLRSACLAPSTMMNSRAAAAQ